ncbi:chemotaxis protein CheW [Bacillus benzoevorans]|nr:chemotaxis protein CheW [Bacillus benzoevorans]
MSEIMAKEIKLIVFKLNGKDYGIPVNDVYGIEKVQHITRVPGTAVFIKGVINLRGIVTPVIDLRKRFCMEECPYSDETRIIIVAHNDIEVGLIVDAANDVIDINEDSIEPSPEVGDYEEDDSISGVVKLEKRLLILIDLEKVLDPKKIKTAGQ